MDTNTITEARSARWSLVQSRMADGLPQPILVDVTASLTIRFDDLAAAQVWAQALGITPDAIRRAGTHGLLLSSWIGQTSDGLAVQVFAHEPVSAAAPDVYDASVEDVEQLDDEIARRSAEAATVAPPVKQWPTSEEIEANYMVLNTVDSPDEPRRSAEAGIADESAVTS